MRRWAAIAGIAAVGVALGAGLAWASIPDSNGVIHTCYKNTKWRVINAPSHSCDPTETALSIDPGAVHPVIRTFTQTIPSGGEATFTAHCNPGEVATGGGWRFVGFNPVGPLTVDGSVPQSSSPEPSAGQVPIGWKVVGVVNNDTITHDVMAFAVCAPGS